MRGCDTVGGIVRVCVCECVSTWCVLRVRLNGPRKICNCNRIVIAFDEVYCRPVYVVYMVLKKIRSSLQGFIFQTSQSEKK